MVYRASVLEGSMRSLMIYREYLRDVCSLMVYSEYLKGIWDL
jgi:hypothetical protein